jgi:hypothetical protein
VLLGASGRLILAQEPHTGLLAPTATIILKLTLGQHQLKRDKHRQRWLQNEHRQHAKDNLGMMHMDAEEQEEKGEIIKRRIIAEKRVADPK